MARWVAGGGGLDAAQLKASTRRELLRAVPLIPLHPSPPTVTLGEGNVATDIAGGVDIPFDSPVIRWTACDGVEQPSGWYQIGHTPNSAAFDRGMPFSVDFDIDTADFEIRIAGQNNNRCYKLWVDGQPLTFDTQVGPGTTSSTHRLRLTFGSRKPRHIRLLTDAGIVGLTVGPTDAVWASTRPFYSERVYFLGDSFTVGAAVTYIMDSYVYKLCEVFGWEPMAGGQQGTGYSNDGAGGGFTRSTFLNRAAVDVPPTDPDRVIIYGGTNDAYEGLEAAAAATYATLADELPGVPVHVFGCQYPGSAPDTGRDAKDGAIQAAAEAAPNVVQFESVKSWVTGTGNAGSPAGDGNADSVTSGDGLHPTPAGHAYLAARMARELIPAITG